MEHNEARKKMSTFIDGEVKETEKEAIWQHISGCQECNKEYKLFLSQVEILKSIKDIEPSNYFRSKFNEKASAIQPEKIMFPLFKWLPVPVALSALIVMFTFLLIASPRIYGINNAGAQKQALDIAQASFFNNAGQKILAPLNFSDFCDKCGMMLCQCCKNKNCENKCMQGGNIHEQQK